MWKPDPRRKRGGSRGAGSTGFAKEPAQLAEESFGAAGGREAGKVESVGYARDAGGSEPGAGRDSGESNEPPRSRRCEPTPAQRAMGLLTRREHSRRELTRKLVARGVTNEDATVAVDKLAEAGWQDDRRFAGSIARTRVAAGFGPMRIRAELGMHGLDREQVGTAIDVCDVDWAQAAQATLGRRFSTDALKDPKQRRKAVDFLLRRGFDHSSAYAAVGRRGGSDDEIASDG